MDDTAGATHVTRRGLLAGGVGVVGAGCVGGRGSDGGSDGTGDDPSTLDTHPVGEALAAQPRLGPDPATATATIVAFEDPSCPRCAAFEETTVPKIRRELVDPGEAAFVVRTAPLVYPWGEPAIHALEATYARDADAFWSLLGHYFERQDAFDTENVLDRTETFLDEQTGVDAAAVVADAESGAMDEAVQTDVSAAEAADVSGTPTVFLFRDGEYRTRATGSVSFDFVTQALEL
ncbi:Thioredoxin [Haloplanus vescus]|uniref:Thioredoxin n=1 Tax=Haloplanus vescus TaxID=555874 RepID=A0A1H3W799_9EURY|nr:thioredoxin domain-containing protein [Haloplanus vescus]SDZ82946.1 Thioredoxin [Haloplanus vescus]